MNRFGWVVVILLSVLAATPASAVKWSIGANAGFGIFAPSDISTPGGTLQLENVTEFAWPNSGITPGLRIGFAGESPQHEFYIDTGLSFFSTKVPGTSLEISASDLSLTGNYQYNFGVAGSVAPYVTAGAGIVFEREKNEANDPPDDLSATGGVFGGGVGIRHRMGNGHGTLRAEVRFDRLTEGKDGDTIVILEGNLITFRVGFDLWDQ